MEFESQLPEYDLKKNMNDLDTQINEVQLSLSNNVRNTITDLHDFDREDLSQLPYYKIEEDIQDLMDYLSHEKLNEKGSKILLDKHLIWQTDFVAIKLFGYFIRIIYRNDDFPQNKTIRYNKE